MSRITILSCLLFTIFQSFVRSQRTSVGSDSDLPQSGLLNQPMLMIEDVMFGTNLVSSVDQSIDQSTCQSIADLRVDLIWSAHASAGILSTPSVDQSINGKSIVVSTIEQHLSLIDQSGNQLRGSPLIVQSSGTQSTEFLTSPVLIDLNLDGVNDLVWINLDGSIIFVNGDLEATPRLLRPTIKIPKLKVRRHWHDGLKDVPYNPVDNRNDQSDNQSNDQSKSPKRRLMAVDEDQSSNQPIDPSTDPLFEHFLDNLPPEAVASLLLLSNDQSTSLIQLDDQSDLQYPIDDEWVWVDAHVLSTPSLTDLNGDGLINELVIAVSYYFDVAEYEADPSKYRHLPIGLNVHNFVAGGVIAYDLLTMDMLMNVHLDLSTDMTSLKALIEGSPYIVDLDGDGEMEIIIGTGLGLLYVMDQAGSVRDGFPFVMGEIASSVAVDDVNSDGELEIVATDARGNVVAVSRHGEKVWGAQASGLATQPAVLGDINGDGHLDVVVATNSGQVWAFDGRDGTTLEHFPLKTSGQIRAPVTLTRLASSPLRDPMNTLNENGRMLPFSHNDDRLHLVFPSFDGLVHIADGKMGCSRSIDIGERVYAKILVDDLRDNGHLTFLVASMNGNVHALSTDSPSHPLLLQHGRSNTPQALAIDRHGVYFHDVTRKESRRHGAHVDVTFVIVDSRAMTKQSGIIPPRYNVSLFISGELVPVYNAIFNTTGEHSVRFSAPTQPFDGVITVSMFNEHRQHFVDTTRMQINKQFHRTIKYLLLGPFLLSVLLIVLDVRIKLPQQSLLPGGGRADD